MKSLSEKKCTKCGVVQPLTEYHKEGHRVRPDCKSCTRLRHRGRYYKHQAKKVAYSRWYYKEFPDKARGTHLKKKYGIDHVGYAELLGKQKGLCAICGRPERATRFGKVKVLAVDHCHKTKKVRGLLCADCNVSIGKFREDPVVLRRAALYLELSLDFDPELFSLEE